MYMRRYNVIFIKFIFTGNLLLYQKPFFLSYDFLKISGRTLNDIYNSHLNWH